MKIQKKTITSFIFISLAAIIIFSYANLSDFLNQVDALSDLGNYKVFFDLSSNLPSPDYRFEIGFSSLTWALSKLFNFKSYVALVMFFLWLALYISFSSIVRSLFLAFVLAGFFIVYFPPYESITMVVLRQGIASAFAIIFLPRLQTLNRSNWQTVVFCLILMSLHLSAVVFIIGFFLEKQFALRNLFIFWIILSIAYVMNISGKIGVTMLSLSGVSLDVLNSFDRVDLDYKVGFKLNFFIFNLLSPILFVLVHFFKSKHKADFPSFNEFIFKLFLVTNSIAMMFSLSTFSDRIFAWSWVLIPLILVGLVPGINVRQRSSISIN